MAIKKITPEEMQKMQLLLIKKRGRSHSVRTMIEQMAVNEIISVDREDFKWKNRTPKIIINQISKKGKKRFNLWLKQDGTGWVIQRIK